MFEHLKRITAAKQETWPRSCALGALIGGLFLAVAAPVQAETPLSCSLSAAQYTTDLAPNLEGAWTLLLGPGETEMLAGGMKMPIPLAPAGSMGVTILWQNDQAEIIWPLATPVALLPLSEEQIPAPVEIEGEAHWVDPAQLSQSPDCGGGAPLWVGIDTVAKSIDGAREIHRRLALQPVSDRMLAGILDEVDQPDNTAPVRRLVTLVRND